ncbi:glycerate kinase [Heyndrickxia acidicola]|uniref:Glycerate kinase n=1 Tax=Heyndrickxia acidicola TaxID=209389 RepID=A0ABU6MIH1_9BACI|nr:glycerate kinase [Heyndrickxia acidicola]MED1204466.1 glycerate kinase [Heyndrickxia acidicola]
MKIVVAPDSFKESLTSIEVAQSIENGFLKVFPNAEIIKIPMADGGEGTVQSLIHATGGSTHSASVSGPLGEPVNAIYGILGNGKTAVIEMASASGLHLVPFNKRNPMFTSTRGTGELILSALAHDIQHIIIGIGGSATNDGGMGMAKALGVRFTDHEGNDIGEGGGALAKLAKIDVSDLDERLSNVKIEVACDVDNPLTGPKGASAIYGPQKGATPKMADLLDHYLAHYAFVIERDLGKHINNIPGAGAAGGLGAGLLAFLPSILNKGVDIVMEAVDLAKHVMDADIVITGEGKIDSQTVFGKTPIGVARIAKQLNVPVIAIAGSIADDYSKVYEYGLDAVFSIIPGVVKLEHAFSHTSLYIENTVRNIARILKMNRA